MKIFFNFCALIFCIQSFGQITSSGIRGVINNGGKPTEAVTIKAVHEPTGTVFFTTSQKNGNFTLPNLQSGGPYIITITEIGFTTQTFKDIYLTLGNYYNLNTDLQTSNVEMKEVVVTTTASRKKKTGNLGTV